MVCLLMLGEVISDSNSFLVKRKKKKYHQITRVRKHTSTDKYLYCLVEHFHPNSLVRKKINL